MATETGMKVFVGPANKIVIGTVNTGTAAATVEDVDATQQRLNLTIPAPSQELVTAAESSATAANSSASSATDAKTAAENVVTRANAGEFKGEPGAIANAADLIVGQDMLTGTDPRAPIIIDSNTPWAVPFSDNAGNVAGGFRPDATWELQKPPKFPAQVATRTVVAAIGDSLVRGYTLGTAWDVSEAWPAFMANILPGVNVTNLGFGGNPSGEIMMRLPALTGYFTPDGGAIPASGAVTIKTNQKLGLVASRSTSINGTLAGVYGTMTFDGATAYTFTRTAAGVAVPVTVPTPLIVDRGTEYSGHTTICWMGRNDISYTTPGSETDVIEHVVANHVRMDQWHRAQRKQYAPVSVTNRVDEPRGSEKYNIVIAINDQLKALFPGRYIDARTWLVNQAIYDAGLTPTADDLEHMANDTMPPQITDGGSHYTKPIAPLLAARFAAFLKERGWVL